MCRSRAEGTAGRKKLRSPSHTVVLVFQLSGNSGKGTKGQRSSEGRLAAGMGNHLLPSAPVGKKQQRGRGAALAGGGGASNAHGMRGAQAAHPGEEERGWQGLHGREVWDRPPAPGTGWDMGIDLFMGISVSLQA